MPLPTGTIMKTLRLHAPHDLRIHEEPIPDARQGETLLRIGSVGICGSDLHWFSEQGIGDARLTQPLSSGTNFRPSPPPDSA